MTVWSRYIKLILNPLQGDGEMAGQVVTAWSCYRATGRDCMELLQGDNWAGRDCMELL